MRASSFGDWSEPPLSPEEIEAQDPLVRARRRRAQAEPPPPEAKPETVMRTYDDGNGLSDGHSGSADILPLALARFWFTGNVVGVKSVMLGCLIGNLG
jgi:hypothetical protein